MQITLLRVSRECAALFTSAAHSSALAAIVKSCPRGTISREKMARNGIIG